MSERGWFTRYGLALGTLTYFLGAMFLFAVMVAEPHANASVLRISSCTVFVGGIFIALCGLFAKDRADEIGDEQRHAGTRPIRRSVSPTPRTHSRSWDDDSWGSWVE